VPPSASTGDDQARLALLLKKKKSPLDFSSGLFSNPAEVQTELARAAAFDQIAADRYFASSRLNEVGFAAGL
jgi:hypothetical protein